LEQRDLGNCKTDLHQIFRDVGTFGVDVQSGIGFRIGQGTLPWQPILGAKSATRLPSSWDSRFTTDGKADERVNSMKVMSTSCKNLVNFGPLTLEFMLMVWQPFMRQMGEIGETRSILGIRIRQRTAGTAERICAIFTRKTCLVIRSYEFECQGQRSKVKVTRNKERAVHSEHPAVLTEWNAVVADNVAQAANATSPSLMRGLLFRMWSCKTTLL